MTELLLRGYTVEVYDHGNSKAYRITENGSSNFCYFEYVNQNVMYFADHDSAGTYTVSNDHEYTYKILKTKVKAIGGAAGLYKHFVECINHDFAVDSWVVSPIKQILNHCKPRKDF